MNGADVVRDLRARGILVRVLVMTAAYDARDWAEEIGALAYITKPLSLPWLLRRLADLAA
jgi:DNA-binding response OmpR family regulator